MSNKLYEENDIQNIANAIRNKNGTEDTYKVSQMSTAIDSIEVIEQATAEGESLSLTNTKAMPYSDYVIEGKSTQEGTPSPSNPSEIHSVADDVNLFDASKIANSSIVVKDNGKTIIMPLVTSGNGNTNTSTKLNVLCPDLQVGDVIYIRFKRNLNNNRNKFIYLYGSNRVLYASENSPSYTITQEDLNSYVFLYGNDYDYGETQQIIITDFKIQKNKITPYSPYNQGTVTIKQENMKNYLNWDKFIDYSNWTNSNSLGYKSFEITGLDINKTYTLCRTDTAGYGETSKYAGFNKGNNNGNIFLHSTDSSKNLQSVSDIPSGDGKIYITMYMSSQSDLNAYINIIKKCWVIEDTEYQEYVNNNYTIQTEPLKSLPNGAKDTIEADGVHRRVGRLVLDGSENYSTNSSWNYTNTNGYIYSFGNTSTDLLSNYFKYNSFAYGNDISGSMCIVWGNRLLLRIDKTIASDVNAFKTWLSTHNTEVLYPLTEEVIEPFTQNQANTMLDIIKTGSYEGTTNIYTDEDVKPTIGVDYYKKK